MTFFRRRFARLFWPAVVCAWCEPGQRKVLRRGGLLWNRRRVSHGICVSCKPKLTAARERV